MMLMMVFVPVERRCLYPHNSHVRAHVLMHRMSRTCFLRYGRLNFLGRRSYSGQLSQTKGILPNRLFYQDSRLKSGPMAGSAFNPMCW